MGSSCYPVESHVLGHIDEHAFRDKHTATCASATIPSQLMNISYILFIHVRQQALMSVRLTPRAVCVRTLLLMVAVLVAEIAREQHPSWLQQVSVTLSAAAYGGCECSWVITRVRWCLLLGSSY